MLAVDKAFLIAKITRLTFLAHPVYHYRLPVSIRHERIRRNDDDSKCVASRHTAAPFAPFAPSVRQRKYKVRSQATVAQFVKWADFLMASSGNRQTQCPFRELGKMLANFVKWAVSQIGRNIYTVFLFPLTSAYTK